jgi:hypothetical protein
MEPDTLLIGEFAIILMAAQLVTLSFFGQVFYKRKFVF